ncbi:MAG: pectinacetylesterase family protein [Spirochaetaceae bacterium]|jgi:hypothetical protein|nr:pectinacetylesterase family protein [Spirochaetaceae bacterium]
MNISGPIESITIAGRRFPVNGDDAGNVILAGFKNEVKFNGDGSKRLIRSRVNGSIKNLNVQVTHENRDLEFMRDQQSKADFFDISITYCDGTVYAGSMQFVDDITEDTQQGTAGISLEGDLEMQS